MAGPLWVFGSELAEALYPVGQRAPIELRLEPVEERVKPGQESARRLLRDPPVRHQKVRRVTFGGQLETEDRLLAARHLRDWRDVPLVFEDTPGLPDEDPSRRMVAGRPRHHLDT